MSYTINDDNAKRRMRAMAAQDHQFDDLDYLFRDTLKLESSHREQLDQSWARLRERIEASHQQIHLELADRVLADLGLRQRFVCGQHWCIPELTFALTLRHA